MENIGQLKCLRLHNNDTTPKYLNSFQENSIGLRLHNNDTTPKSHPFYQ